MLHGRRFALDPFEPVVEGTDTDQEGDHAQHRAGDQRRFSRPRIQPH